jgi:hypothetical protein
LLTPRLCISTRLTRGAHLLVTASGSGHWKGTLVEFIRVLAPSFGILLLSFFSLFPASADEANDKSNLRKELEIRAAIYSDWLQHYASLLPSINRTIGNNDNASAEETSDPYTQQKASDISLVADGSDFELVFSCDFTRRRVTVAAIGKNLQAMKTAEFGLFPNPVTKVTQDPFNPDFYKARGNWAVATRRIIPNGDHGLIVGQWGGKYVNACRDNGEFRDIDALYCSRSDTKKLRTNYERATVSSVDAATQLFDFRNWTDFEVVKMSLLNGTEYIFTQDLYPNREPFKRFFESCAPDQTKVFGEGFYEGAVMFRPSLADSFRNRLNEAKELFENEMLATREFAKLAE